MFMRLENIAAMIEKNDSGFIGCFLDPCDRPGFIWNESDCRFESGDWIECEDSAELCCDADFRIIGFFGRYFAIPDIG